MQIDARIRFNLGSEPNLSDLRDFVEITKKFPDNARVAWEIARGQRDSETVTLVVQGDSLLDR
jgi:hypothetical protein